MIKKFLSICLTLTLINTLSGASEIHELPPVYYVIPHWLSRNFVLETPDHKIGTVYHRIQSLAAEYQLQDAQGLLQARAIQRFFPGGAIFDIIGSEQNLIGTIEENLATHFTTFRIVSPLQGILATSSLNFWGTTYSVISPFHADPIATLYRPFFRLKDDWTTTIHEPTAFAADKIDPVLFLLVTALQTDVDYWSRLAALQHEGLMAMKKFPTKFHVDLVNLNVELRHYRQAFAHPEIPTEEDCAEIIALTSPLLESFAKCNPMEPQDLFIHSGYALLHLLDTETLTPKQKHTLLFMLEQVAREE